ncbi:serine--tRNA ligase [Canna indica]|uniref:serine--tRNA ligase n=1 Tax=Canna indica TaxID=4628 RepID=A0AAQ3KXA7_9LILI|nr:serine--tRNA ligase [Canna indica]
MASSIRVNTTTLYVAYLTLFLFAVKVVISQTKEDPEVKLCKRQCGKQQQFDEQQKQECRSACEEYARMKERTEKRQAHVEEPEKQLEHCKHECRVSQQSERRRQQCERRCEDKYEEEMKEKQKESEADNTCERWSGFPDSRRLTVLSSPTVLASIATPPLETNSPVVACPHASCRTAGAKIHLQLALASRLSPIALASRPSSSPQRSLVRDLILQAIMLDINLFRAEKGFDPEIIRESQRRRFASVDVVDEVIHLDREWRQRQFELDGLRRDANRLTKEVKNLKIAGKDATEVISSTEETKKLIAAKELEVQEAKATLDAKLETIGNLIHDTVPVSNDEANNAVIRAWGDKRMEGKLRNHVDLVKLLDIVDLERGADVAGGRGFYLKGDGVLLNLALVNFGLAFLSERRYESMQTPFFMRKDIMAKCAQLAQFDEELYKVTGEGDDKYLIATAEQPLCAYHLNDRIYPQDLPIRYAGYSTCFRKEAGSHGRDTLGIFRVHQFEKIEQFCITSPNDNDSWEMHEEMLRHSEDFYKELKLPYQVVAIVSGALNDAAAKKYDLEGWFPASKTYRELVSCSNCTDYQSRRLGIGFGQKKARIFSFLLDVICF